MTQYPVRSKIAERMRLHLILSEMCIDIAKKDLALAPGWLAAADRFKLRSDRACLTWAMLGPPLRIRKR